MSAPLVELGDLVQVVRVHDDVQAAQLAQLELALLHTRKADLQARGSPASVCLIRHNKAV
jgi:hypothetical protein